MLLREVRSSEDVVNLVEEIGFLPFFANDIPGLSIEECCPPELWFSAETDGPWEWKGPIARSLKCVYGKFCSGRAMFISRDWFPDFANLRRDGYDFDARFNDGLAQYKDRDIYETIVREKYLLSKELKRMLNYRKGGNRGFDTVITRLQMQSYVCISDFVYMLDRFGAPYGWGVAEYTTPEELLGVEFVTSAYSRDLGESGERIAEHLRNIVPQADTSRLNKLIGIR